MVESDPVDVDAVCIPCAFGRGDDRACVLIEEGDRDRLFGEGPCQLGDRVRALALSVVRRRYPFARSLEEDVASDVVLRVLESERLLVPGQIRHLPVLERRLHETVRNAVIDALRHHKVLARLRCGACVNFDKEKLPPGCQLRELPDIGTEAQPNPWYGDKVEHGTDPRGLKPPCEVFEWRRPETHDIFEEEIPGMNAGGTPRERAVALLVQAIDRLSRRDASGMRAAAALFWHYLRGKEVKTLATEGAVSEKTIKRLLSDGRERILEILQNDFAIADVSEVF